MDGQNEKFPWKVCAAVIVLTVLAMSAVDVHKKRKAGEAQASAQMAVQVPDYSQTGITSAVETRNVSSGSGGMPESAKDAGPWYVGMLSEGAEGCAQVSTTPELFVHDLRSAGTDGKIYEVSKNGNNVIVVEISTGSLAFTEDIGLCEDMVRRMSILLQRRSRGLE